MVGPLRMLSIVPQHYLSGYATPRRCRGHDRDPYFTDDLKPMSYLTNRDPVPGCALLSLPNIRDQEALLLDEEVFFLWVGHFFTGVYPTACRRVLPMSTPNPVDFSRIGGLAVSSRDTENQYDS